jgi:long-chain acyl-CoA synthetase
LVSAFFALLFAVLCAFALKVFHAMTPQGTLPQKLLHWARTRPDAIAFRQKDYGIWQPYTWADYARLARHFGLGLTALGLPHGGHVAIISENRKEWVIAQLGLGMVGGVTAGVYATSPAPEVEHLLVSSDAVMAICEDQEQVDKVLEIRGRLPLLGRIVVIDPKGMRRYDKTGLSTFEEVLELGAAYERTHPTLVDERLAQQTVHDVALMIFTSGSTGKPKAAMLSYDNMNAATEGALAIYGFSAEDTVVSYLPLCHVAEQSFSVFFPLAVGCTVNFAESLRTVQTDLREIGPSLFLGVPRIWEKLHASIHIRVSQSGALRRRLFERATEAVRPFADKPRDSWTAGQRMRHALWYALVFRSLLNFIGLRRCRLAFSGTAPIAPDLLTFYRALGVPIREIYGMTEVSGISTGQRSGASPTGTVGAPIPTVELKLAADGEVLMRGRTVFKGYYRNPQATADAIDADGWLHSGDVGEWTGDEVRIVDRKKDIMITSGGKNISPSEVENTLKFSPYIKEAIAIGERRNFVSALIQIDYESVGKWAEDHGIAYTNFRNLAENPKVRDLVQAEVDKANARMPRVQNVRKFHLLTKELDHDDGEVTATMKLRRRSIAEKYGDVIEALYGEKPAEQAA